MDQALEFLQEVGEDSEAAVVPVEHVGKVFKSVVTAAETGFSTGPQVFPIPEVRTRLYV